MNQADSFTRGSPWLCTWAVCMGRGDRMGRQTAHEQLATGWCSWAGGCDRAHSVAQAGGRRAAWVRVRQVGVVVHVGWHRHRQAWSCTQATQTGGICTSSCEAGGHRWSWLCMRGGCVHGVVQAGGEWTAQVGACGTSMQGGWHMQGGHTCDRLHELRMHLMSVRRGGLTLKYRPKAWCYCWRCIHRMARRKPPGSVLSWICP